MSLCLLQDTASSQGQCQPQLVQVTMCDNYCVFGLSLNLLHVAYDMSRCQCFFFNPTVRREAPGRNLSACDPQAYARDFFEIFLSTKNYYTDCVNWLVFRRLVQ